MKVASVFQNGPSAQAVIIPKEYRFKTKEVWIERVGNAIVLRPKPGSWDDFFNDPQQLSDNFSMDRGQQPPQLVE